MSKPVSKRKREDSSVVKIVADGNCSSTFRIIVGTYEHVLYGIDAITTYISKSASIAVIFNPVWIFEAHTGAVKSVAVGGRYLASGGADEVIKLYDMRKRKDLGSLLSHDGSITHLTFPTTSRSPHHMVSCDENNKIIIWRVKDWTPMIEIKTRHGRVNYVSIHPTGKIALSVGADHNVRLWNLVTGKKAAAHWIGKEEGLSVHWNVRGDGYAVQFDKSISLYDMSAVVIHEWRVSSRVHTIHFFSLPGSNEEILGVALENGTIHLYNTETKELVQEFKGHKTRVKCLSTELVLPQGLEDPVLILASASTDGIVKLWSIGKQDKWVEVGMYNCGDSRITCMTLADAGVEDLSEVVKRRMGRQTEDEVKSESDDELSHFYHGNEAEAKDEVEFNGFD